MSHLTRLPDGIPQGLIESSLVLSTTVQQECTSYDKNISRMMKFLNHGLTEKVSQIYSSIVDTCTEFGCRNHLRDLHLQVSDYFKKKINRFIGLPPIHLVTIIPRLQQTLLRLWG